MRSKIGNALPIISEYNSLNQTLDISFHCLCSDKDFALLLFELTKAYSNPLDMHAYTLYHTLALHIHAMIIVLIIICCTASSLRISVSRLPRNSSFYIVNYNYTKCSKK